MRHTYNPSPREGVVVGSGVQDQSQHGDWNKNGPLEGPVQARVRPCLKTKRATQGSAELALVAKTEDLSSILLQAREVEGEQTPASGPLLSTRVPCHICLPQP